MLNPDFCKMNTTGLLIATFAAVIALSSRPISATEEVGPNDLRIGLGLGPAFLNSQFEPRLQSEYQFGGAFFGGFGQMPEWNYSSASGQNLRIAYLRNEWLFELDQKSEYSSIEFSSYLQGTFNTTSVTRSSNHSGEYSHNRTGFLFGWDALHPGRHSLYVLIGFRSIREEFLNEKTSITGLNVSGSDFVIAGASPENQSLATAGTVYLGLDFTYQFESPFALQFRLGLESGTGDWEETDILYGLNNSFEYRKEIGSTEITGLELDITFKHEINLDWTFFTSLQTYQLSLRTKEVIPLLANSTPPTSAQILQDVALTYGGAEHRGRATSLLFGFTYSYRFW
ncbi:MAG TPA: hypothetical protein DEA96_14080 [Leptospiraceae bacterium]|nr:hypothetical protein [Spirochaetaceae bacterium]HBS06091.1 hypothetical protein [Leptospiraceae bacterium]|tara:strand:+ start:60211 stop:61233 length:1023 start_codon:yes stop_codon:yes gene_type:complete